MSAAASPLYADGPPEVTQAGSCGVRDVDWQLKAFRDVIEQRHRRTAPLRSVEIRTEGHPTPLEAMIEWATSAGAAVARIHRTDADTSVTAFVSVLATGRAPVISAGSARLLHALHGRHVAQLRFLEGLLRCHARHRAILIVVDDRATLDTETAWLVQQLAGLLQDVAVTWVHPARLQPAPDASIVRGATDVTLFSRASATTAEPSSVGLVPAGPTQPPLTHTALACPPRSSSEHTKPRRADTHPRNPKRPRFGWLALTDTELRVVRLVVQGHTNRATAAALFVSANTISTHLRSIYSKLDVNSRVQLTRVALPHLSEAHRGLAPAPPGLGEGATR